MIVVRKADVRVLRLKLELGEQHKDGIDSVHSGGRHFTDTPVPLLQSTTSVFVWFEITPQGMLRSLRLSESEEDLAAHLGVVPEAYL